MDTIELEHRRDALRKEHHDVEQQIAQLGFRRAMIQGALLEIDRMLKPPVAAEDNGHSA